MSPIAKSGPERGATVGMASARFEASVKPTEARKEAGRNCVGVRHRMHEANGRYLDRGTLSARTRLSSDPFWRAIILSTSGLEAVQPVRAPGGW
jgi:hypothetical protein